MWDPLLSPSGPAGVTTVITGNCGVGCAPTRATEADREFMISTLGAIEDIPAEVLREGTQWNVGGKEWESFPEYLDALSQLHFAVDIACLVPHSCIRPFVLGVERADQLDRPGAPVDNPLTQDEKQAVAECVREAVEAGAIGFSTNRFRDHRDHRGVLAPGTLASADEVVMCAKACAEAGAIMFDMHSDFVGYDDVVPDKMDPTLRQEHYDREWAWIHFIAKEYGLTVQWLGNAPIEELDKAMANGESIYNQFLVRPQAFIMSFASRGHPFVASATFRRIQEQVPEEEWGALLTEESTRAAILSEVYELIQIADAAEADSNRGGKNQQPMDEETDVQFAKMYRRQWGVDKAWNSFYPIIEGWDYEPERKHSISSLALASNTGQTRLEVAYDFMCTANATGTIWRGSPDVSLTHHQSPPPLADVSVYN